MFHIGNRGYYSNTKLALTLIYTRYYFQSKFTPFQFIIDRIHLATRQIGSGISDNYWKQGEIWVAMFSVRPFYRGGANFNIEDYFSKSLLNKYVFKTFKSLDTIVTKDNVKRSLDRDCNAMPDKEFKHSKSVFEVAYQVLSQHSKPLKEFEQTPIHATKISADFSAVETHKSPL